jgi:hypothetical protein
MTDTPPANGWQATTNPDELIARLLEYFDRYTLGSVSPLHAEIEASFRAIRAQERERCAKHLERLIAGLPNDTEKQTAARLALRKAVGDLRALPDDPTDGGERG